jgi:hypothetical protein
MECQIVDQEFVSLSVKSCPICNVRARWRNLSTSVTLGSVEVCLQISLSIAGSSDFSPPPAFGELPQRTWILPVGFNHCLNVVIHYVCVCMMRMTWKSMDTFVCSRKQIPVWWWWFPLGWSHRGQWWGCFMLL